MKKLLIVSGAVILSLVSCVKEPWSADQDLQGGAIPLNISSSIDQVQTKATAQGFVDGDAVGLYAVNYSENNTVQGILIDEGNQADNVKYVFDESSQKWLPVKSVYYKDVNTNVDIILYYPFQKSISDVNNANFEVKKDQSKSESLTELSGYEASDFLWGMASNVTPTQSAISIPLYHKLSAVQVTLIEKSGFGDGEFENLEKNVMVTNTTRKATINYATGEATKLGEPQADGIVMCPQDDGSYRAIVVPQSVASATRLFAITIDGVTYGFKQDAVTEYLVGKQMNFNINITKKTPSGEYELTLGSVQITDWTEDKNTHGGEARQYFVVNVETPGTLGAQIKAMGKNPDKIKNLKVVGNVKDDDFYFMRDSMEILEAVNMKEAVIKTSKQTLASINVDDSKKAYFIKKYGQPETLGTSNIVWSHTGQIIPRKAFSGKSSLTYFVFPEDVTMIDEGAFSESLLSGSLIIPDEVLIIGDRAFNETKITSIQFPSSLECIGNSAFFSCSNLSGQLLFPPSLRFVGGGSFEYDKGLSGRLLFPESICYIGPRAFYGCEGFSGDLEIPENVTDIYSSTFDACRGLKGSLVLHENVALNENGMPCLSESSLIGGGAQFAGCGFTGELIIPSCNSIIPESSFSGCNFANIVFPESIKSIESSAFSANKGLSGTLELNEGLLSVSDYAFNDCSNMLALHIPSTLSAIGQYAFCDCYYLSGIFCDAIEPPTIFSGTFDGVAKDNFALEVPEASIIRYQTEVGWSDFKRVTAHYDFSIGRTRMRALNEGMIRTYTLRCPAGNDWSVTDKPDWITVTPSSGTGKTDVTISIGAMPRTEELFEVNDGSFQYPSYANYKGRIDTVVFKLADKDYTCRLEVEQYDYDKCDGEVIVNQTHSTGRGIDVVFIGEGYDAKDIAKGKFLTDCENGYNHLFNIEPYKTYKDYFNVYSVVSWSDESGIETVNTILDNKFMKNGVRDVNAALKWAKKASSNIDLSKTVVILLDNSKNYYGWTYMYGDGSAMSVVPISEEAYPYDYRGLIQHEAGGHAFGKLGDEYIYHNAYITSCSCGCCDHPSEEYDPYSSFGMYKSLGWFKNLSMYSDHNQVPWSHLMFHTKYSNRVDMYEGAYMHMRGMYRSEITSCMNNNIPYFNSISRQAIVERIKDYAGETFDFNDFVTRDNFDVGTKSSRTDFDWTFGVDPNWNRGTEKGSIIYMGDHPDVD